MTLVLILLALYTGHRLGWNAAHVTVARECERLGKFYVGDKVFHCDRIETPVPKSSTEPADATKPE